MLLSMTPFECTRCGKCCMNATEFLEIEKRLSGRNFACRMKITGERFIASIEEEHLPLFNDPAFRPPSSRWCPFLRPVAGTDEYICTVHTSRPQICRGFTCCTMRIYGSDGRAVGSVKGRRSLSTADAALKDCWENHISSIVTDEEKTWKEQVRAALREHGYRVEIYE